MISGAPRACRCTWAAPPRAGMPPEGGRAAVGGERGVGPSCRPEGADQLQRAPTLTLTRTRTRNRNRNRNRNRTLTRTCTRTPSRSSRLPLARAARVASHRRTAMNGRAPSDGALTTTRLDVPSLQLHAHVTLQLVQTAPHPRCSPRSPLALPRSPLALPSPPLALPSLSPRLPSLSPRSPSLSPRSRLARLSHQVEARARSLPMPRLWHAADGDGEPTSAAGAGNKPRSRGERRGGGRSRRGGEWAVGVSAADHGPRAGGEARARPGVDDGAARTALHLQKGATAMVGHLPPRVGQLTGAAVRKKAPADRARGRDGGSLSAKLRSRQAIDRAGARGRRRRRGRASSRSRVLHLLQVVLLPSMAP